MAAPTMCITANCRTPQHNCTRCPCPHEETVFDRAVCPSPCDTMHTYCLDCGDALETCYWDGVDIED